MTNALTPEFSTRQINQFLENEYQLTGTLSPLPGYCDQNLLLTCANNQSYIIKIANNNEPKIELEMQNAAMAHLHKKSMATPYCLSNANGQLISHIVNETKQAFSFRVLTFLEGQFYAQSKGDAHTPALWHSLGNFLGKIDNALADFEHAGAYRYLEWDLAQGYGVCQSKKHLLTGQQLELVEYFLNYYQINTLPQLAKLPQCVIHNDANDYNLLIDDISQPSRITGLIDFGDMVYSHKINELAVACAYALMNQQQPIVTLKHIVAAYHKLSPISDNELYVLYSLIALRLCTTVCNSAKAIKESPDNDYLLISVKPAWHLLQQLKAEPAFNVLCQLKLACNKPIDNGLSRKEIINFRQQHLGRSLSLSFKEPIKIVSGQGAYLFDEQGNGYLDMVNNVCHVGHCHPKVVAAGQAQMAMLNTNTRFLHDNIVNYAKKLLATMPDELSVCMFVNSGSEANELAFRLAKNFTKSTEFLVVDGAYHGNTAACIDASPYKFNGPGGNGKPEHVHIVELPDPYRGKYTGNSPATSQAYAANVRENIENLTSNNKKVAAFICESLQGVAGQIIMPDNYLKQAYQEVHAVGGVCIADEVQVGFGRVGSHMWAFETQNVVPDIVTLGKPIGNGHPLAAVITTQEIADAFVTGMEYFNTFGGNPVSCAIGSAVLDVIQQEKLQQHALATGNYLLDKLKQLQLTFPIIGDVRGLGLFIGVELVEDQTTKAPATEKTAWLIEFFKQHFVLLSTEGRFYNILKIKPPLAFTRSDADKFIKVLEMGLKQLS